MKITFFIFLSTISSVLSQGVFVYKNHNFHDDSGAHAFVYTSISEQDPVTWVIRGGERIRFEKHQFHQWIHIRSQLPTELLTDTQIRSFQLEVSEVAAFYKRFQRARPLIQASLDSMTQVVEKLNSGQLLYQNRWISRGEYALLQEASRIEEARKLNEKLMLAARIKEEEKKARAEAEAMIERRKELARQNREMRREQRIGDIQTAVLNIKSEIQKTESNQSTFIVKLNQLLNDQ